MRLLPPICLVAFFALLPDPGLNAAESPAGSATIWRMDDPTQVGGSAATVLGAPRVFDEAGKKALYFDGVGDGLLLPVNPLEGLAQFTVEVLIRPEASGQEEQRFLHIQDKTGSRCLLEIRLKDGQWALDSFLRSETNQASRAQLDRTKLHPANRWTWVALVYAKGRMAHFVNGAPEMEGAVDFPPMEAGKISLGVRQNKVFWFKGSIREVRFHAVALAPEEMQKTPAAK
jgi:hypothetical protein